MKPEFSSILIRLLLVTIIVFFVHPTIRDSHISDELKNARHYIQTGQPEKAESELESLRIVEPWRELPWSELADVFLEKGKPQRSISILEPLSRESVLTSNAWLILAKGYAQIGQPDRMEAALISLLALQESGPVTVEAYLMLINLYRSQNRFADALERQSALVKIAPETKEFLFDKVLLMLALQPEEGLQEWKRTTAKPAWLAQLGSQLETAMKEENEVRRMVKLGQTFGSFAYWDLSEYWLEQAVKISPDYAEAWAFLAEARQERGLDGKEQITHALELAPKSQGVRALASIYYRRQKDFNKAMELIWMNISDRPKESIWYMELGSIQAETGKMEDAADAYQKAVDLAPADFAKLTALARFCTQYDYQVAEIGIPAAEKAVALAPEEPEAQDIYGLTLLGIGEYKKASQAFSVALSLNAEYAPTWLHIGQAALAEGDATLAKEALIKTVKIAGNSSEAQTARRLLEQYYLIDLNSLNK